MNDVGVDRMNQATDLCIEDTLLNRGCAYGFYAWHQVFVMFLLSIVRFFRKHKHTHSSFCLFSQYVELRTFLTASTPKQIKHVQYFDVAVHLSFRHGLFDMSAWMTCL